MEECRFPKLETYYTCLGAMQNRFEEEGQQDRMTAANLDEYLIWKRQTRKLLANLIGLLKMNPVSLRRKPWRKWNWRMAFFGKR